MIEQAAGWAAQLATDEATQEDRDACAAWCREHPLHEQAMRRMRGLDARLGGSGDVGRETIEAVLEARTRGRRLGTTTAVVLVLVLGAGWLATQSQAWRARFPDYRTAHGEQRTVRLADGSGLTLDSDAALDVEENRASRTVTLFRGQMLAQVAKDPARPFVVTTRDGTATALGTAFSVHREARGTTVTVLQSRVRACPAGGPAGGPEDACATLVPGERARMTGGRLERLARVDPDSAGLWASGWLAVDDQPVAAVLAELNRYLRDPVQVEGADLAGLRISGSFPLREPDRALDAISRSAGLEIVPAPDGGRMVRRTK